MYSQSVSSNLQKERHTLDIASHLKKSKNMASSNSHIKQFALAFLLLMIGVSSLQAATYYSRGTGGNWNANTTWSTTGHAGAAVGAGVYPVAGDVVYIGAQTVTVTANAACASITFDVTGGTLTVNSGITLTVSGTVALNGTTTNMTALIAGAGSINCASVSVAPTDPTPTTNGIVTYTITSTITSLSVSGNLTIKSYVGNNNNRRGNGAFTITSGTVSVNGTIQTINENANNTSTLTLGNTNPTLILSGTTPFTLSGTGTNVTTLNGTGATVRYTLTSGGQTIRTSTYNNLSLENTSGANTADGAITVSGSFTTASGGTFSTANDLTLNGATSCGGTISATAGTVNYAGTTSTNIIQGTYSGLTLARGIAYTQCGATTVNGTLAFSTAGATLATSNDLTLNGATITNPANCTLNASAGTVNYAYNGAQSIIPGTYYNLETYNGSVTKTLAGAITINNILTWNNGNIALSTYNLTLAPTASISTSTAYSATHMFVCNGAATSGSLIKQSTNAAGLQTIYPVGTGTSYSPMNVTSLSATVTSPATISVSTVPTYYSAGGVSSTDLNRYWIVDSTNLADVAVDITFTYVDADVAGTESDYQGALYLGNWAYFGAVNTTANTFTTGSTGSLGGVWTARKPALTYFSYQSGNWDEATTWTLDASGTIYSNPSAAIPGAVDNVYILNGRTVTVDNNGNTVSSLEIQEGAILDVTNSNTQNYGSISGKGRMRSTRGALPSGTYTLFTQSGGGTIELYGNITSSPELSLTTFNNLEMNGDAGQNLYMVSNTQINGNLLVSGGIMNINRSGTIALDVTVLGDITINSGCTFTMGTGNAQHNLYVQGNFTNNGTVTFTTATPAAPTYTTNPARSITLTFNNDTQDQELNCKNTTTLHKLVVDKGTDDTYKLSVNADATNYFYLLGRNDQDATNTDDPGNVINNKALEVLAGTLYLGSGISIPRLLTAGAGTNLYYAIDQDAAIVLNGATVNVTEQTNLSSIVIYGKLYIIGSSTFTSTGTQGIILRAYGLLDIEKASSEPTVTTTAFRTSSRLELGTHRGTFIMTGGTLNISGDNYADTHPAFTLPFGDNTFQMSGGTININNSTYYDGGQASYWSWLVSANASNISVTGGTVNINASARNAYINSTAPFYNLNFTGNTSYTSQIQSITAQIDGGNTVVPAAALRELIVLNNLSIGAGATLITNNQNVTVGGNFTLNATGTYTPGVNTTTFNGYGLQAFTNAGTITSGLYNAALINSSVLTISNDLTVRNNLSIDSETTLRDNDNSINVAGNITNNGRHESTGDGSIILNGTGDQLINGNGEGIFGNLSLNKTAGTTTQNANISVTGNLRLANTAAVLNIGSNELALSATSFIYDNLTANTNTGFSATRMIQTSGVQSDMGVKRAYTSIGTTIFPVGSSGKYTPAKLEMDSNPTAWGSVTINPVNSTHPLITDTNALKYYWNVRRTEMGGFTAGNLRLKFYYNDADVVGTENRYKPAWYFPAEWTFVNDSNKVTDATNEILFDAIDSPRGHYTAGQSSSFGAVKTYYSRQTGNWDDGSDGNYTSWTNDIGTNDPAATLPNESSPVVIRPGHTITVTTNSKRIGSLEIQGNAILDITTSVDHFFGIIYQTTVSGTGTLRISSSTTTAEFPGGDFGEFLGENGGTVEYYTSGTDFTIPSGSTTTTTLLSEGFESAFPPTGWIRYNIDGAGTQWESSTTRHTGSLSAAHTYSTNPTSGQNGMLVTPALDMRDGGSYELSFYRYNNYPTDYVYQGIWISTTTNSASSFSELAELGQGTSSWQTFNIDLSSYAGNPTVYIAFVYQGYYADNVYIDDVLVTKTAGSFNYHNLVCNPESAHTITLPEVSLTTYGDFTVKGAGITNTSSALSNTLTVNGNTSIEETGTLRIDNNKTQILVLNDSLSIANGASLLVNTDGASAQPHKIYLYGDVVNEGTFDLFPGSSKYADLYFVGTNNCTFSGTNTDAVANFNRVYVDKGTSQTPVVDITASKFDMNTSLEQALTITNGTIRFTGSALTPILTTSSSFTIPSTGCLSVNGSTVTIGNSASDAADLYLLGKLDVRGGTMNIGNPANTNNNDIEYYSAGTPEVAVSGGTLNVNGQIRRPTTILTGNLTYRQSGGDVYIYGKSRQTSRALLEVLNSGSFYSSGSGNLYLVNGVASTTTPTYGDLYINAATYTVTGGTIHTGTSATAAATNYFNLYLGTPIWSLTVNGETNEKAAVLQTFPATINGDLVLGTAGGTSSFIDTKGLDVNIGGDFKNYSTRSNPYVYSTTTQTTTFTGKKVSQSIYNNSSTLDLNFRHVVISNSQTNGKVSFSGNRQMVIFGDLTVQAGTFEANNRYVSLFGNMTNNSIYSSVGSGGYIFFYSTSNQYIYGTNGAEFGNFRIRASKAVIANISFKLNGQLYLYANSFLNLGDNKLTISTTGSIGNYGSTQFIVTNGALSDLGVTKEYTSSGGSFTFPVGVGSDGGKYTPVIMNVTNTGGVAGSITVKPVDQPHPMRTEMLLNDELQYFWKVTSTGFNNPTVSHTYTYTDLDVLGTESTYVNARMYDFTWYPQTEVIDYTNNLIKFTSVNYIDGDYTAGAVGNWGTILKYYSAGNGNWSQSSSWLLDSPTGSPAGTPPNGNPVFIQKNHTITTNQDGAYAGAVNIDTLGTLYLGTKTGHNLGYISGKGTIHIDATAAGSFIFPGGDPTEFMNTAGSTVQYSGNGTIPSNIETYQNILFTGNNTKTIPATDITVLGNLTISAGYLDNNINDRTITLHGNWSSSVNGGYIYGSSRVILAGGNAQTITATGGETFYNLTLSKTAGTIATLGSQLKVTRSFTLSSGIISTDISNILYMTWDDPTALSGGSSTAYIDGPMKKTIRNSSYFNFPVGDDGRYGPVYISGTSSSGSQDWIGQYYNVAPTDNTNLTPPLQLISNNEYWEVTGVSGARSNVRLRWDTDSQIIPATAAEREKIRVAEYQPPWTIVGSTIVDGGQTSGTVGTSTPIGYLGVAKKFTIGLEVLASGQITGIDATVCDDGTLMPVTFAVVGDEPLKLYYLINGANRDSLTNLTADSHIVNFTYDDLYAISGAGDYVITIDEVVDGNGLNGIVLSGDATLSILPTPNPVISGATTVMINATNKYSVGYTSTNTYAWTVASTTGTASATLSDADSCVVSSTWGAGTGTVTLQLVETAPNGCNKTVTYVVTVRDWPVIVGNFNVCANATEVYYSKEVAGHYYGWTVVGGTILDTPPYSYQITVQWSTESAGTITLQQGASSPYTEISQNVTINPSPTASLTISGSSSICDDEPVTLLLSRTGAGAFYTFYLQKDGADYMSFDQSVATTNPYSYTTENLVWITGTPNDDYTFSLRVVNNTTGCSSAWDDKVVSVYKTPETGPEYHIPNTYGF